MKEIASVDELVAHLRETGDVLFAPEQLHESARDRSLLAENGPTGDWLLSTSKPAPSESDWGDPGGLGPRYGQLLVSESLYQTLCKEIQDDCSAVRRHSSRPIERAFVFVDVSDFSKLASGVQLLVVLALIRLAKETQKVVRVSAEAQLCIGDGYIFVFKSAVTATFFASPLALAIEHAVAGGIVPDFHFRIGVHAGLVRCFWDPGRNGWNYVGDGINGAQRVLGAIGKETDDVVYVSAQVRQRILRSGWSDQVVATLDNKGRKADKHGNAWRVYQVNHTAFSAEGYREEPGAPPEKQP
ncbi:MAG TPA: adenylate/guanylate cyclase domain-containing protein [Polyangiaceae bacterium]|nr:adenylate/guanylate cyclase domain-containing protein [Polyangiaceae bacterium]